MENLTLTKDEISDIKNELEENDNFKEFKDDDDQVNVDSLKELKKISNEDYISLGILYARCFKILRQVKNYLKPENKLSKFFNKVDLPKDFEDNVEYYKNGNFGTYFRGLRIRKYVLDNKKDINTFIDLFFEIFGDE